MNAGSREVPHVDRRVASAIAAAADEVADGAYDDQFPIDVFQTGSGTSIEHEHERGARAPGVGAPGRAGAVHPNDQVNVSQSSNDVFPSAVHLAAAAARSPTS